VGEFFWKCFLLGPSAAVAGTRPGLAPEPTAERLSAYFAEAATAAEAAAAAAPKARPAEASDKAAEGGEFFDCSADKEEDAGSSDDDMPPLDDGGPPPLDGDNSDDGSPPPLLESGGRRAGGESKEESWALEESKEESGPPSTFGFEVVVDLPSATDFDSTPFEVPSSCVSFVPESHARYARSQVLSYVDCLLANVACAAADFFFSRVRIFSRCWCGPTCQWKSSGAPFGGRP
jgi:hypothetical protein